MGPPGSRDAGKLACERTQNVCKLLVTQFWPHWNEEHINDPTAAWKPAANQGSHAVRVPVARHVAPSQHFVAAGFVAILIAENWPSRRAFDFLLRSGRGRLSGRERFPRVARIILESPKVGVEANAITPAMATFVGINTRRLGCHGCTLSERSVAGSAPRVSSRRSISGARGIIRFVGAGTVTDNHGGTRGAAAGHGGNEQEVRR